MFTFMSYFLGFVVCFVGIILYFSENGIKKDSWHYKVVKSFDSHFLWGEDKLPLCPYVQRLCFALLAYSVGVCFAIFLAGFMLAVLFWGLYDIARPVDIAVIACVLWGVAGYMALCASKELCPESKYNPSFNAPTLMVYGKPSNYVKKEPSLFSLYMKALHDKACPILDIKD